jgi:transcriptional regulator with GAF, ATPase, and Fis domain
MSDYPQIRDVKKDTAIPLRARIVTFGASPDCTVRVTERGTPARVAHLLFLRGQHRLQALADPSLVMVNGKPLDSARELHHADRISIMGRQFRYLQREDTTEDSASPTPSASPVQDLVGAVIALLRNRDAQVAETLVASVSGLLHCDAARLVSTEHEDSPSRTIARYPADIGLDRFSNRAIEWARDAQKAVLVQDVEWQESGESMSSLELNAVSSVLCVPLRDGATILGFLYLDRMRKGEPFGEADRAFCDQLAPLFSQILSSQQEKQRQRDTIARLQHDRLQQSGGIIHGSSSVADLLRQADKVAQTSAPVLVLGETGTGKELLARYVHDHSPRSGKPFRAVNCGALPENLIESELFGHEKGAFTGAHQRKIGLFESANTGTVFLDEVGELPLQLQVKLLRVLQESEITRVGGTQTISVDVRIVAATNRDLGKEVSRGQFRQDLFFRLNVLPLTLPPLRERGEDLLLLADYFLTRYCAQFGLPKKSISSPAREALISHPWPGNIRELENVIQKAVLLAPGPRIEASDIRFSATDIPLPDANTPATTLREARAAAERSIITHTIARTGGNVSLTAKLLEIDRKWLMKKLDEFGIDADEYRQ